MRSIANDRTTRSTPPLPSVKKPNFQNLGKRKPLRESGVALVFVGEVFESVFCEGVSVETLIGSSYLIDSLVEGEIRVSEGIEDFLNGSSVIFGDVVLVGGNYMV